MYKRQKVNEDSQETIEGTQGKNPGGVFKRGNNSKHRRSYNNKKVISWGKKVEQLWKATITERPPKHLIISDVATVTGSTSIFAGTVINQGAPFLAYLNLMSRGTTVQQRLADYCYWSKINIRLQFLSSTALASNARIKYMICEQKQCQGSGIAASAFGTDMFGSTTPNTNMYPNINNHNVKQKYKVLTHGTLKTTAYLAADKLFEYHVINWFSNQHVKTSYVLGNAGTIADIDTGAIFIYIYTDLPSADTSTAVFGEGQLFFRDQV
jgi:hypothetical protein